VPALVILVVVFTATYLYWRFRYGGVPAGRPQVLCFHKISERFCWEGTWTTPRRFFAYVDRLRSLGYNFITMEEYLATLGEPAEGGDAPTDGRRLLLTFDDGYSDLFELVLPGLESRAVPFHVFLVTEYIGRNNEWDVSLGRRPFRHLDWPEIVEMANRGVTFGSHGATHADLRGLSRERLRDELARSRTTLEERLGPGVRTLSYPFGRFDSSVESMAREAGFEAAFSLYPPHLNSKFDRFAIRRNAVYIIDPISMIETKLEAGPLFWLEEIKCRAINGVAALTPLIKRHSRDPDN